MKKSLGPRTLIHPAPVLVVGTYNDDNKPNVMTASWGGLCCSMPPCVAVSLRQATCTYGNIVRHKAFTVGIPSQKFVKEIDYFGLVTGRSADKFADTGLTPVRSEVVDAPYVGEFPIVLECQLLHVLEIGLHTLFVGEILDVKVDEDVLTPDGHTDMSKAKPIVFQPDAQAYHAIGASLGKAFSIGQQL
jgi:flavin reductase (DIM6/NTAB) family NADH-FMN oxidoreductase RutF